MNGGVSTVRISLYIVVEHQLLDFIVFVMLYGKKKLVCWNYWGQYITNFAIEYEVEHDCGQFRVEHSQSQRENLDNSTEVADVRHIEPKTFPFQNLRRT